MNWFRLYAEFATDPKVQSLSETLQRRYIMLLCYKCNGDLEKMTPDEIAFGMRISPADLETTLEELRKKRLIGEGVEILAWDKRQYKSDTSAERVRKHRDMKRYSNGHVTKRNVTVTAPDTDTDTDTERKKEGVAAPPPTLAQKLLALKNSDCLMEITAYCQEHGLKRDILKELERFTQYCLSGKGKYSNHKAAFKNWLLNDNFRKDPYATYQPKPTKLDIAREGLERARAERERRSAENTG